MGPYTKLWGLEYLIQNFYSNMNYVNDIGNVTMYSNMNYENDIGNVTMKSNIFNFNLFTLWIIIWK